MPVSDGKLKLTQAATELETLINSIESHASNHEDGGIDEIDVLSLGGYTGETTKFIRADGTLAVPPGSGGISFGTTAGTACEGNDSRLSDNRTPVDHATSHISGAGDELNVLSLAGYSGDTTKFIRADGTLAVPPGGSVTHHTTHESGGEDEISILNLGGFTGSTTNFLRADGSFAAASGTSTTVVNSSSALGVTVGTTGSGAAYECDGTADEVQFNAALTALNSGETLYVLPGNYYCAARIYQAGKNVNIVGIGNVTIYLDTPADVNYNGLTLQGSIIATNVLLSSNAAAGASQVVLTSGSGIQIGDLIKIYNNVLWSPTDENNPNQTTGEMYRVTGVSTNTITLNEPLLRAYTTAAASKVIVYRPIKVLIDNIKIVDAGWTEYRMGISLRYCADSEVKNCYLSDSGLTALAVYASWNVYIHHNQIYNCDYTGSGYGVSLWDGVAYVYIYHNHIENCHHTVSSNMADKYALNRKIHIRFNTLITTKNETKEGHIVDCHTCNVDYFVEYNWMKAYVDASSCFFDGSYHSVFANNYVSGGLGIVKRGNCDTGDHRYYNNYLELGTSGYLYKSNGNGTCNSLTIENNTLSGGKYGIRFYSTYPEVYRYINIRNNTFLNISSIGIYIQLAANAQNININDNIIESCASGGIYIDGLTYTSGTIRILGNKIRDPYTVSSGNAVILTNIDNAQIHNNEISDFVNKTSVGIYEGTGCSGNVITNNIKINVT